MVRHPNVIDVHRMEDSAPHLYIVMEYVDGDDLEHIVKTSGPLPFRRAAEMIRQAADGLANAHHAGLVHRDVKPANLLLTSRGTVKVLDFGLAKCVGETEDSITLTTGTDLLGTVDFMSPEQAADSHYVDSRADIYSLGCTLYFLLTGHAPFPTGGFAERLMKHTCELPDCVSGKRPDMPGELLGILNRMIAKHPTERIQTADEVRDLLAAYLGHTKAPANCVVPVVHHGGEPLTQPRRPLRRATAPPMASLCPWCRRRRRPCLLELQRLLPLPRRRLVNRSRSRSAAKRVGSCRQWRFSSRS